jgi:hypothetical protein
VPIYIFLTISVPKMFTTILSYKIFEKYLCRADENKTGIPGYEASRPKEAATELLKIIGIKE